MASGNDKIQEEFVLLGAALTILFLSVKSWMSRMIPIRILGLGRIKRKFLGCGREPVS